MTTLTLIDGQQGETRTQATARRVRETLGGKRVSISELGRRIGMTQSAISRRVNGEIPFDVEQLDQVADAIGSTFLWLSAGIRELPQGPDDGASAPSRARTEDLRIKRLHEWPAIVRPFAAAS